MWQLRPVLIIHAGRLLSILSAQHSITFLAEEPWQLNGPCEASALLLNEITLKIAAAPKAAAVNLWVLLNFVIFRSLGLRSLLTVVPNMGKSG